MTIKVSAIVGAACIGPFDSCAAAIAYLKNLNMWDFELIPVVQAPEVSELTAHAVVAIDKDPDLTFEGFADLIMVDDDELTMGSILKAYNKAKHFHSAIFPNRTTIPLPMLAFLAFKENDYNLMTAYRWLRSERNLTHLEARNAVIEAGIIAKD